MYNDPFPMHSYPMKLVGLGLAVLGILYLAFLYIFNHPVTVINFNFEEQLQLGFWAFTLGLFFMAFSKEKIDDERVQRIRQVALRSGFQLLAQYFLVFHLAGLIFDFEVKFSIYILTGTLIFYHLIFYYALIRNPDWAYHDTTVAEKYKANKWFFITLALVVGLLIAVGILIDYLKN